MRLRAAVFKYRGLLWGIFVLAIFIFPVSFSPLRMLLGVPLVLAGQALRFWAAGVIQKYRTLVIGAPVLVTWGPYAWTRNPLYAGNGLMGCGWALMAGWWWVVVFMLLFFVIYSLVIIPGEEKFLLGHFGEEYERFRRCTPSLLPRLFDARRRTRSRQGDFDGRRSWSLERHSLRMNGVITLLILIRLIWLNG